MRYIFPLAMAITIGAITVTSIASSIKRTVNNTKNVSSACSIDQIKVALELYYLDHNMYPKADDAKGLIKLLLNEGYINKSINGSNFIYRSKDGNSYLIKAK